MQLLKEEINQKEIFRYLGYKGQEPDNKVKILTQELLGELLQKISPKYIYKSYEISINESTINFFHKDTHQEFLLKSKQLSDNLKDCHEAYLMAVTLGFEADKLLKKYEVINIAKASIVQACGAACVEALCDMAQNEIATFVKLKDCYLRPRFSAGYGDLGLENQKILFEQLDCTKRLGLTLTEDMLMYPTKSVTAIIGVTTKMQRNCLSHKCKSCDYVECEFRDEF